MRYPKTIRTYCSHCRKHTEHSVKQVKKKARGKAHPMSQSQKRFERKTKGYRGFPRPKPKPSEKVAKKLDLRLLCRDCKKMHTKRGFRIKKFEMI